MFKKKELFKITFIIEYKILDDNRFFTEINGKYVNGSISTNKDIAYAKFNSITEQEILKESTEILETRII